MKEQQVKTTLTQRIIIIVIALLLLGSTIAAYVAIVVSGNNATSSKKASNAELTKLQEEYTNKQSELSTAAKTLSDRYFADFISYRPEVKSYNATSVNDAGLQTRDLKEGDGRELAEGDINYLAYYIGFCPDESIFDSSLDSTDDPKSLQAPISASIDLIEGWNQGVIGMKIGGVRELSIPGELAYGDSQEICGTKNSPLKFIVMPVEDENVQKIQSEINELSTKINSAALQAN